MCEDEENWRAQYGQVIPPSEEEKKPSFHCNDLWDWRLVRSSRKKVGGKAKRKGKGELAWLVGRPLKQSAKVHPSVPAGGGILRTAPIWQVRYDLVRVRTGLDSHLIKVCFLLYKYLGEVVGARFMCNFNSDFILQGKFISCGLLVQDT